MKRDTLILSPSYDTFDSIFDYDGSPYETWARIILFQGFFYGGYPDFWTDPNVVAPSVPVFRAFTEGVNIDDFWKFAEDLLYHYRKGTLLIYDETYTRIEDALFHAFRNVKNREIAQKGKYRPLARPFPMGITPLDWFNQQ